MRLSTILLFVVASGCAARVQTMGHPDTTEKKTPLEEQYCEYLTPSGIKIVILCDLIPPPTEPDSNLTKISLKLPN